uniref:Uncharacterized protein n=1 Tax=Dolomedes mizhoanus TaxID=1366394 RepID=S5MKC3_9ARAC|nr:hypothetical protein [Dolomedes mizhoanus]
MCNSNGHLHHFYVNGFQKFCNSSDFILSLYCVKLVK